ncbi:hypothetical protein JL721_5593 [Aureococcus anophagefferens]|nr:hypothetical protein JL721_5593 [Aureococcus anophagefferens]
MCDVSAMPMNSPFARPMSYFSKVAPVLERELVAAEAVLAKLLQQLAQFEVGGSVASWLEGDSTQSFFEFQLAPDKDLERVFKNVELLASKCYNPNGVVLIAIYFLGTFYVALGDSAGEQPLLDSRFPDVSSKGRGYLIASYAEGTPAWPQLRKAPAAAPEETKEQRDARIEALLTAQPKKKPSGLAPLSPLGSKVNAPHRVPAMAGGAALNEKLAKMRAELGTLGKEAPCDEFGRPKALAFKK